MTFALSDLIDPETQEEALDSLLSIAASLGLPTTAWQTGSPIRSLLTTIAQKVADLSEVSTEITRGGFGDLLSSDAWADAWAESIYDETRIQAVAATGLINIDNSSGTQYDLAIGALIVAHATTGKTYRNTAAISILAGTGVDDVTIQCDETGTVGNAAPATVTVLVNSLAGVTLTNPLAVLGADKETTAALVERCRAKLGSLSPNGPKDAYNYIATTPAFSAVATPITRTNTVSDSATGIVTTYLATASGAPVAGDVTIVQAAFEEWAEPWGVQAVAVAATPLTVNVAYQVWVSGSNLTQAQIETAIGNALSVWFASLDIGGYVISPDTGAIYVDALQQVIGTATPGILRVSVTTPAGTTAMTANQVAVLGTVTPTITFI